jgi:hypothetical protein
MTDRYFIHDGSEQRGPLSIDELRNIGLNESFWVWKEGNSDWLPINEVSELLPLLPVKPPIFNKIPPEFKKAPPAFSPTTVSEPLKQVVQTITEKPKIELKGFELIGITSQRIYGLASKKGEDIGRIICGCKTYDDISFVIIGIPIWFNHYRDFIIFTDKGFLLITKTLWGSWKYVFMEYSLISHFTITKRKIANVNIFIKDVAIRMSNRNLFNQTNKFKPILDTLTTINIEQ